MRHDPHNAKQRLAVWILAAALGGDPLLAAAGAPMPGAGSEIDRLISALEGGWAGADNDTPFGKMPFSALFEWQLDGSLHSRSPLNSQTWIDLRFSRDDQGRWMLREEAAMEGLGTQRYELVPSGHTTADGLHRWVWKSDPDFLAIDLGVEQETMRLDVTLRGEPHVAFRLDRQPRASWAAMKRDMLARAAQSPEEGLSIHQVVSKPPAAVAAPADPIESARQAVAAAPDNAEARVALAMALRDAIADNPANGPRYAFEMLAALRRAIELDPHLTAAYHGLVGYYLNAPPIAGGSLEKAAETARRLAELDSEAGRALLEQIAARQAGSPAG